MARKMAPAPGDPIEDFQARNQDGKTVRLSDFRGKPVLLYFYPKDDTPGCIREACSFRDDWSKFKRFDAVVLGVSRQGEDSHQKFRSKFGLPFDLLVDGDGELARTVGVTRLPLIGMHMRQSVLIGPDGRLVRIYDKVDPDAHVEEVLDDLSKLAASQR